VVRFKQQDICFHTNYHHLILMKVSTNTNISITYSGIIKHMVVN